MTDRTEAFTLLTQFPISQPKGNQTMNANPSTPVVDLTPADYQQLDRLDEEQMLAEFRGEVLEQFVYQFPSGGKTVTGLSWAGIKQMANRMGEVAIDLIHLADNRDGWAVIVKASKGSDSRLGAAFQPRLMKVRGEEQDDPFALPKAVSKAQRNAIRALLPETLVTEAIKAWLAEYRPSSGGNGHTGGNGHGRKPVQPPVEEGEVVTHARITWQGNAEAPRPNPAVEEARSILVPEGKSKGKKLGDLDRAKWQIIAGDAYKPTTPEGLRFKQAAALLLAQAA